MPATGAHPGRLVHVLTWAFAVDGGIRTPGLFVPLVPVLHDLAASCRSRQCSGVPRRGFAHQAAAARLLVSRKKMPPDVADHDHDPALGRGTVTAYSLGSSSC
jgi:hypothetical protein